jgi:hypothetical protein
MGGLLGGVVVFVLLAVAALVLCGRRRNAAESKAKMMAIPATSMGDDYEDQGGYPVTQLEYARPQPSGYEVLTYRDHAAESRPQPRSTPARARSLATAPAAPGKGYEHATYRGTSSAYSPRRTRAPSGPAYNDFYETR